jgi:hypothetical protein
MSGVLIYAQTHRDDPWENGAESGVLGIHDCLGRNRSRDFDYVIAMYRHKISWVGIDAQKVPCPGYDPQVIFKHFMFFPALDIPAPPELIAFVAPFARKLGIHPFHMQTKSPLNLKIKDVLELAINAPPSKGKGGKVFKRCRFVQEEEA